MPPTIYFGRLESLIEQQFSMSNFFIFIAFDFDENLAASLESRNWKINIFVPNKKIVEKNS